MFLPCPECAGEEYDTSAAEDEAPQRWRCGCCQQLWLVTREGFQEASDEEEADEEEAEAEYLRQTPAEAAARKALLRQQAAMVQETTMNQRNRRPWHS